MRIAVLGLAACLMAGVASAQTTGSNPGSATGTGATPPATTSAPPTQPNATTNQAVTSPTQPNATTPATGANSFSEGQAKSRIEQQGYTNVSDLKKDDDGVWRGHAEEKGRPVQVWLDFKGNVGQEQ